MFSFINYQGIEIVIAIYSARVKTFSDKNVFKHTLKSNFMIDELRNKILYKLILLRNTEKKNKT